MLTLEQIDRLADQVNDRVNLPIIGERFERIIFRFIIRRIDEVISENIPEELYAAINNAQDGLTDTEAEELKVTLTVFINQQMNIPLVREKREAKFFGRIVSCIVDGLRVGETL